VLDEPLDACEAGRRLRVRHEALLDFSGSLPSMALLTEAEAIVGRLASDGVLPPDDVSVLRRRGERARARVKQFDLPMRPVHGDAGVGNVLTAARGVWWNHWVDTFLGPRAWDLTCLQASAPPFGSRDLCLIARARAGYGDEVTLSAVEAFIEGPALSGWCVGCGDRAGQG
jgi:hypothetical protein